MQISQPSIMLRETRNSLVEVFNNHDAGSLVIGDQKFDDLVQKYFLTKTDNNVYEKIVKPIITRNLYESEGVAAGSAEIFLRLLSGYFDHKNDKFSNIKWNNINSTLNLCAKVKPRKKEIFDIIKQRCTPTISSIIIDALEQAQKDDQIEVTRSFDLKTSLTTSNGCNFKNLKIDPAYCNTKVWKRSRPNVILIDGIIEKSIHVEHLLSLSNKDKNSYIIICREATDEVKNVCITNFLRQTTDVILCTAPYNEKTAHIFEDLKIITNADVICPELGDVITAAIYKKSVQVNSVEINTSGMILENGKEIELKAQRDRLLKSISEINDDDVSDLIRKRIKSLSSNRLIIRVGNDTLLSNRNAIEQIDKILREIKDIFSSGYVDVKFYMPFINHDRTMCSTRSVRVGLDTFLSFTKVLEESGLILMS